LKKNIIVMTSMIIDQFLIYLKNQRMM